MNCSRSEKQCRECELNTECRIYNDRYVLMGELKKLRKSLEDALVVVKAVARKK